MCRKGVAKRVTARTLGECCSADRVGDGALKERWPELEAALRTQHLTQPVESTVVRPFGESSTIRATLTGPGGKSSVVVSVWFRAQGATAPHLVTAYPGGEK
ncbi:MAG: DUF6883 domain-containing protein [Acidimicrobiia bacterium]